jgi:hypothetical protein
MDDKVRGQVKSLLLAGDDFNALKLIRKKTGADLDQAKLIAQGLEENMPKDKK